MEMEIKVAEQELIENMIDDLEGYVYLYRSCLYPTPLFSDYEDEKLNSFMYEIMRMQKQELENYIKKFENYTPKFQKCKKEIV